MTSLLSPIHGTPYAGGEKPAFLAVNGSGLQETLKINLSGGGAPGVSNDSSQGYAIGSRWYHGAVVYECTDATVGAAVWTQVSAQALTGLVPYSGATGNIDLGAHNLTTTGLSTLGSIKSGILYPSTDAVTAIQFRKADGTTVVANIDTTNNRLGIGTVAPSALFHGIATTEQFRFGYDASNYLSGTVDTTGVVSYTSVGTAPAHVFLGGVIGAREGVEINGTIEAPEDAGAITLFNMEISSTPAAGTEMSASFKIDNDNIVKIYAEADGSGGEQNPRLYVYGDLYLSARNIVTDTTTGLKIGTATDQKLGFFNATPVVQPTAVVDAAAGDTVDAEARTALNNLLARLRTLGIIAAS